jgi:predicted metalloprotease
LRDTRGRKPVFFSQAVNTACGTASSAVGPFYCPADRKVYIDLGFYDELRTRFGAKGGPFAEAYVIAHEYGHHVENLIGVLARSQSRETGPQSPAVRVELMADCLAGMWASGAVDTGFIEDLTEEDIRDGLDAAAAVGDDRIQHAAQGRVDPESFTHGSAEARKRWFTNGYRATSMDNCDTFNAPRL